MKELSSHEWHERRQGNNRAQSNHIAISYLYRNIQQYFGAERGQAIIRWLQIGLGEAQTFDEACKARLLSEAFVSEVRQAADQIDFSAFSTEDREWVQATQDRYRELVQKLPSCVEVSE